ncbi:MAG: hypothetical protein AAGF15_09635 [Pseudomonadota bacterium]
MKKAFYVSFIALVVIGIGYAVWLPSERTATKRIRFDLACTDIWDVYRDVESQGDWRADIETIEIVSATNPRAWIEHFEQGPDIKFTEISSAAGQNLRLAFEAEGFFTGSYNASFREDEKGCLGTFTETVYLESLWSKIMSYLFFDLEEAIDLYAESAASEARNRSPQIP